MILKSHPLCCYSSLVRLALGAALGRSREPLVAVFYGSCAIVLHLTHKSDIALQVSIQQMCLPQQYLSKPPNYLRSKARSIEINYIVFREFRSLLLVSLRLIQLWINISIVIKNWKYRKTLNLNPSHLIKIIDPI